MPTRVLSKVLSFTETGCLVSTQHYTYYCRDVITIVHTDKPSSAVHKSSTKQQASHDTSLVEELTSMDIRTQMIIKRFSNVTNCVHIMNEMCHRLRELISKLSEPIPDVETVEGSSQ